ncbi:hypothetical protein FACS18942_10980 [Planctomycetales bacterium]|nr:hypothetical protein FACS18942_10980 [Planctomycetales bacterium]GHT33828.1 hypothetical protein FACS189427_00090 [Planctomycetales bacterium]
MEGQAMLTILQNVSLFTDVINKAIKIGKGLKKMFFKHKETPAGSNIVFVPVIVVYDKEESK